MSNRAHRSPRKIARKWHAMFLRMLPRIRLHARIAFRSFQREQRQEAIQDVTANAWQAFVRLVERGKAALAYATPLAMYGVRQYRDHRRVGAALNVNDITSTYCQQRKGVVVQRLDKFDRSANQWEEVLVEDRHAGPADIARMRLDFAAFLARLPLRLRRIAKFLAQGESTTAAAEKFGVSLGRISQIRKELKLAWNRFSGDDELASGVPV